GGLFPLDEKGNMQGLLDMGVYPEALPGYQPYAENMEKFGKVWNAQLPSGGLDADGILQGIEAGQVKFLYLAATNPLSFPNAARWRRALEKVDFLVVQDILPTEVTRLAKVVLPGSSFAEKGGSVTSLDHRVRPLASAIRPVGDSREDWEIFADLYARLTKIPVSISRADILAEVSGLSGLYGDICFVGSDRNKPCLKQPYSPVTKSFNYRPINGSENVDGLQLLSGKSIFHFGTTSTFAPTQLELVPEGRIEMNPQDAAAASLNDGESVKISSDLGTANGRLRLSPSVPAGLVFAPYHFVEQGIQQLLLDGTNRTTVTISKV
ncbi:MAG TPA: molybdopterin-dependent oxidoreductase, partial [Geopsychrobacteraceae bacterium]|nr:molybdopterin-dependent oxidoreductase [Geopsychrobacteraceae bacterium]